MNVLLMGLPFGAGAEPVDRFRSQAGHSIWTLAAEGTADCSFSADLTVAEIVAALPDEWIPDLLLCWCPEVLPPPRALQESPIKTVAVVSDWTVYYPQLEDNLARYDVVITDRLGANTLRCPGVTPYYIAPLYSHRTGIHRQLPVVKDIDIAFAGNLNHATHVQRGRLLEKVAALSSRYKVVIASELPVEEYTALSSRARIVFNHCLRREMNLRCFETMACGALLFVEAENLEVPDWVRDREEAVFYREDNLVELLHHYLARPEETTRIAENGLALSERLAGEVRLDNFIDALCTLPESGRLFRAFGAARQAFAEVMQYASSRCPDQRRYAEVALGVACESFPENVALKVSAGCALLNALGDIDTNAADGEAEELLAAFRDAATAAPEAAVLWLNLALLCRQGKAEAAERRFLELALAADSSAYGGLLIGENRDPYYARWRSALAYSTAAVQLLWAAAAARLATLDFEKGDLLSARTYAEKSIAWCDDVAEPYQLLAKISQESGDVAAAAAILEESLCLTVLDADHRIALINVWRTLGRDDEARALAHQSECIFNAWLSATDAATRFRELLASMK